MMGTPALSGSTNPMRVSKALTSRRCGRTDSDWNRFESADDRRTCCGVGVRCLGFGCAADDAEGVDTEELDE